MTKFVKNQNLVVDDFQLKVTTYDIALIPDIKEAIEVGGYNTFMPDRGYSFDFLFRNHKGKKSFLNRLFCNAQKEKRLARVSLWEFKNDIAAMIHPKTVFKAMRLHNCIPARAEHLCSVGIALRYSDLFGIKNVIALGDEIFYIKWNSSLVPLLHNGLLASVQTRNETSGWGFDITTTKFLGVDASDSSIKDEEFIRARSLC